MSLKQVPVDLLSKLWTTAQHYYDQEPHTFLISFVSLSVFVSFWYFIKLFCAYFVEQEHAEAY